jgi:hypothetical protein
MHVLVMGRIAAAIVEMRSKMDAATIRRRLFRVVGIG